MPQMKAMIAETFLAMAQERNIDKITIKDLAETCHISRQTFYYHFQDMLDVIVWSMDQALQEVLARGLKEKTLADSLRVFVSFTMESDLLLLRLLHSQYREQMETLIVQAIHNYLWSLVRRRREKLTLPHADLEAALHFSAFGVVGILLENCGKPSPDPDRLAGQLCRLISGQLLAPIFGP